MNVLDQARLQDLRELAGDELDPIIIVFLDRLEDQLAHIKQSSEDLTALAKQAHSLKGSAANMGADALAKWAAEVEESARKGQLEAIRQLLDSANSVFSDTFAAFAALGFFSRHRGN